MKSIRDGEGVSHFRFGDRWVTICCPICFELFQGDPQQYLGRKLPPRRENPSFGV